MVWFLFPFKFGSYDCFNPSAGRFHQKERLKEVKLVGYRDEKDDVV